MSAPTFTLVTSSDGCKSANLWWTPPTTTNVTVPIRGYTVHYQSYQVTFIVSYILLEVCTCHLWNCTLITVPLYYHCSFTITVPSLSLSLYYHCSFTTTDPSPSLILHYHALIFYYHCIFTITFPLLSLILNSLSLILHRVEF